MEKLRFRKLTYLIIIVLIGILVACGDEGESEPEAVILSEALFVEMMAEVSDLSTAEQVEIPEVDFLFELVPISGEMINDDEDTASLTVPMPTSNIIEITGEGVVYFDEIKFTGAGSFTYLITQIEPEMDDEEAIYDDDNGAENDPDSLLGEWIIDTATFYITVTVLVNDESETLIESVVIKNEEDQEVTEIIFINVYKPYIEEVLEESESDVELEELEELEALEESEELEEVIATPENYTEQASSTIPEDNAVTLSNDQALSYTALVNRNFRLSHDFSPGDLSTVNVQSVHGPHLLRSTAARAAEALFQAAQEESHILVATSGYRSFATQESTHNHWINMMGEEEARRVSARPGHSEHQLGLALDITTQALNGQLSQDFSSTPEGTWVRYNAHRFGFIIRYPQGREADTGYIYEPWHIRYVGVDAATTIHNGGMILEEFLR